MRNFQQEASKLFFSVPKERGKKEEKSDDRGYLIIENIIVDFEFTSSFLSGYIFKNCRFEGDLKFKYIAEYVELYECDLLESLVFEHGFSVLKLTSSVINDGLDIRNKKIIRLDIVQCELGYLSLRNIEPIAINIIDSSIVEIEIFDLHKGQLRIVESKLFHLKIYDKINGYINVSKSWLGLIDLSPNDGSNIKFIGIHEFSSIPKRDLAKIFKGSTRKDNFPGIRMIVRGDLGKFLFSNMRISALFIKPPIFISEIITDSVQWPEKIKVLAILGKENISRAKREIYRGLKLAMKNQSDRFNELC